MVVALHFKVHFIHFFLFHTIFPLSQYIQVQFQVNLTSGSFCFLQLFEIWILVIITLYIYITFFLFMNVDDTENMEGFSAVICIIIQCSNVLIHFFQPNRTSHLSKTNVFLQQKVHFCREILMYSIQGKCRHC